MTVLYALAMLLLLLFGVNLLFLAIGFANADGLLEGDVADPSGTTDSRVNDADLPSITVQLPIYNERYVVERLIDACASLDYPADRLDIQVLDDSTDDTVNIAEQRVAFWKKRGVRILHIRRSDRSGFKAGALQKGLSFSNAEYVAVFDADFVPQSDFLKRVVSRFDSNDIGMIQARWGHLNEDHSLLTRIQAFGLDTHFVIEQRVRNLTGCFINFNGTAGIWRRKCIDDSGGWSADTLAEDLDLSYRAQLRGWRFKFLPQTVAPAELPVEMNAFRAQQFRWTKGTTQTALKMLFPLWKSEQPLPIKLEGTIHLTAHIAFPMVLLITLFHAPLLYLNGTTGSPGSLYFELLSVGFVGFAGFFLAQLLAQRDLHVDWKRRMLLFPLFLAGSMGLSFSNTRAVLEALAGKRSAFVRTPKYDVDLIGTSRKGVKAANATYSNPKILSIVWIEVALLLYSVAGLSWLIGSGHWVAVPFQAIIVLGFALVVTFSLRTEGAPKPGG
ncbi:MAG: glycosyltransferase [Rhodothermales bacterium]|nr:glycosyltransferase [Rhodothermales bacterium]